MTESSDPIDVLWLDDDSPIKPLRIGQFHVITAQSCAEADLKLKDQSNLQWVVVDLIVPQKGWADQFFEHPGIEFIKYLAKQEGRKFKIAAFTRLLVNDLVKEVYAAGADHCYRKTETSLGGLLRALESHE